MTNRALLLVPLICIALSFTTCKKDDDTPPPTPAPSPAIGQWELDRIVLSDFAAPYQSLNGSNLSPIHERIYRYEITIKSDNTFTSKLDNGLNVQTANGTWTLRNTELTLTLRDGSTERYTLNQARTELSGNELINVTLRLTNPNTNAEDPVPGRGRYVLVKQEAL